MTSASADLLTSRAAAGPGFFESGVWPYLILLAAGACFALSLLAIFRAPTMALWIPAIAATEWGYIGAAVAVGLLLLSTPHTVIGKLSLVSSTAAVLLFLSPLTRAMAVVERLPADLRATFGAVQPRQAFDAPSRAVPFSLRDLIVGVGSPHVSVDTVIYSKTAGESLAMDIYGADSSAATLKPAVLIVHGGSWKNGDRHELPSINRYLAARGYLVVAIDYRLAPRWHFPAPREDVFAAIDYLKAHQTKLGWNGKQLVILGRSAGGQIALSAAYAGKEPSVRGAIAFYTPNDLLFGYSIPGNPRIMNSQQVISDYLGGTPKEIPAVYADASPLLSVNANTPPTLTIHGDRDELVWPIHDVRLAAQMKAFNRPYYFLELPWATHGCDANFSGPCGQLSTYAIERFLAAVMPVDAVKKGMLS